MNTNKVDKIVNLLNSLNLGPTTFYTAQGNDNFLITNVKFSEELSRKISEAVLNE